MIEQRAWTKPALPASYFVRNVVLRLVDVLAPVLRGLGIDVPTFRVLLHVTLTVDARGDGGEGARTEHGARRFSGVFLVMVMTAGIGTLLGVVASLAFPIHRAAGLLAMSQLTVGCLMTASSFAALLFDRATASLVSGRPVDDRTVFAARVTPAALFIALIQGALAFPQCVAMAVRNGAWPSLPISLAIALLATVLASAMVLAIFASIMRSVSAERFKTILGRIQIATSLLFIVVPQILPQLPWFRDNPLWELEPGRFGALLPPAWYAEIMAMGTGLDRPPDYLSFGLGLIAPFVCLWLVIRAASGKFVAAMTAPEASDVRARRPRLSILERLAPRVTRSAHERAGYSLCSALQLRDKAAILQIIPGTFVGAVFVLQIAGGPERDFVRALPFLPYAILFAIPQIASCLSRNDSHAASWVIHASPVPSIHPILVGALRATLVRFVLLPSAILIAIACLMGGIASAPIAVVAGLGATAVAITALRTFQYSLPFSEPVRARAEGGIAIVKHIVTIFGAMLVLAIQGSCAETVVAHLAFAVSVGVIAVHGWCALNRKKARGVGLEET